MGSCFQWTFAVDSVINNQINQTNLIHSFTERKKKKDSIERKKRMRESYWRKKLTDSWRWRKNDRKSKSRYLTMSCDMRKPAEFEKSTHPLVFTSKCWVRVSENFHTLARRDE